MKILLVGGGTGGHITPLLAVAHEIKQNHPDFQLIYAGERNSKFSKLVNSSPNISEVKLVYAGKFRRYHGESWLERITDIKTNALNLLDAFKTLIGFFEALWLMVTVRPDAMFVKGGFVAVPVGLAAALFRVPYITHDSDALPGLANRIIARWAKFHAVGMPSGYPYKLERTKYVGVPVAAKFTDKTSGDVVINSKNALGIPGKATVVLVTGGSLGSRTINSAIKTIVPKLLAKHKDLYIIHHVGKGNEHTYGSYKHERLMVEGFIDNFYQAASVSDLMISRSGATAISEAGALSKALITVPAPFLSGGHQLKNAETLSKHKAAIVLHEDDLKNSDTLLAAIESLLTDQKLRLRISSNLHNLTKPDAAKEIVSIIDKELLD